MELLLNRSLKWRSVGVHIAPTWRLDRWWTRVISWRGSWDLIITDIWELERHLRRMKPGKAAGVDGIPADLCHFHAATLGRLLFPVMMKEFVCQTEAAEYKGGRLIYAYKHKGRKDDPASYRGLMLTSVLGKAIRSSFRDLFLPGYRRMMDPTYYSVRASGHVGQASLTLQLFCRHAKNCGHSAGVVFLDIKAAYYNVCRELTSGWQGSDEQIVHILQHFALPHDTLHQLHRFLSAFGGATDLSDLADEHKALLAELSTGSWFRVTGSDVTTQTHGGSRPGDGLADLIFGFTFGRMLDNLKTMLAEKGVWDPTPWVLPVDRGSLLDASADLLTIPAAIDIVWADDGPSKRIRWGTGG